MNKYIIFILGGLLLGACIGLVVIAYTPFVTPSSAPLVPLTYIAGPKQIIGFLPYWLLSKAKVDYSPTITTLAYFALRIADDGSIVTLASPTETEPGWYALESGKVDPFMQAAKNHQVKLSLVLDSGDVVAINGLIADPVVNGKTLVAQVLPLIKEYGFSDINLDIEYTQSASTSSRLAFTQFIKTVRNSLPKPITLTLEVSPIDAIQQRLIDIAHIEPYATHIVVMAYDYHAPDSFVTGPVAPLFGAGVSSEYDVATAVAETLRFITPAKLILGMPLYGYEWETIGTVPRSAIIPGSGVLASNDRIENFLTTCATCSAQWDTDAQEAYVSFFSSDTNTNHLIFVPSQQSTAAKVAFAQKNGLAGLALWALGYEGNTILTPITAYKNN